MRVCLLTAFDQAYREMGEVCAATLRRYAEIHGCDVRVVRDLNTGRPPAWNKIIAIQDTLRAGYDVVFWIDTDALFVRFDAGIRDEIRDGKHLYLVSHHIFLDPMPGMQVRLDVPNTGVMLLRNDPWTVGLLDAIWKREEFLDHRWWENAALIDMLGYGRLLDRQRLNVPNEALMRHVEWLDWNWNSTPGTCVGTRPIIHHYTRSGTYAERLEAMRRDAADTAAADPRLHLDPFEG